MTPFFTALLTYSLGLTPQAALAQGDLHIGVSATKTVKTVVALAPSKTVALPPASNAPSELFAKSMLSTVTADLEFMDLFQFVPAAAFVEKPGAGIQAGEFEWTDWSSIGTELLLKTQVSMKEKAFEIEAILWNVKTQQPQLRKKYEAHERDVKIAAHTLANDLMTAVTGLPGIFLSKIAMSCDRTGKKEIYTMNIDGSEVRQITHHQSLSFAPAWNPQATRLAYSVVTRKKGIKNIDLYEFDFLSSTTRLLSNRKGINSGAAYTPDGTKVAATLSFLGNPEIFLLNPADGSASRLTKSFGFDVDPAFSPDGRQLAFVSSRGGQPMVYRMNLDGSNVQRLTYAGRYNATPAYSPRGDKIVFAGWIEQQFDIFLMNVDGTQIQRLTKAQGNNEDPFFSPDGNFVVFSSNRTGGKNIYVMNRDGSFVRRLTYGLGNCVAPKWSSTPNAGGSR